MVNSDVEGYELLAEASRLGTATLHEAAQRTGAVSSAIHTMTPGHSLAGWAYPVGSPGGDNLWIHRAIYDASPGDVLVVETGGAYEYGYWGEILSQAALARGLGGLVIDAGVRDTVQLQEIGLPIFARGACIRGTIKDPLGVGSLNLPLEVGGVLVNPGDLVVGDEDGVVILPRADVPAILSASVARLQKETDIITRLQGGERTIELLGLDALLGGGASA